MSVFQCAIIATSLIVLTSRWRRVETYQQLYSFTDWNERMQNDDTIFCDLPSSLFFSPHKNVNPLETPPFRKLISVQPVVRKSSFPNDQIKTNDGLTGLVMPQHKCTTENHKTRHVNHCTDNTSNTKRQKHSTQLDIAVRERAYFLWGSSPCLEWRVYTHNASPARRGGSPGQNAPPLWSPGSTGPGLLWYRTGKRRSPCYLQVEGGRQADRWVKYVTKRSVSTELVVLRSFHLVYNPMPSSRWREGK